MYPNSGHNTAQFPCVLKKPRQCKARSFFTFINLRLKVHAISKTDAAKR